MTNPGSREALALGCRCPVLDNHHGEGMPGGLFWISGDCSIHGRGASKPSREEGRSIEEGNEAASSAGGDAPGADVAEVDQAEYVCTCRGEFTCEAHRA